MNQSDVAAPDGWTFSRPTIIVACDLLTNFNHSDFDGLMIQFGVEDRVTSRGGYSLKKKANDLTRVVLGNPFLQVDSVEGAMSLQEAIVRAATGIAPGARDGTQWAAFCSGLERDGFTLIEDEDVRTVHLRRMHPEIADIPAADDEVHLLLKQHQFSTPLGHLEQAMDAHSRGDWASANSQLRSFLEGLFDEIAGRLAPEQFSGATSGHGRRAILANLQEPFIYKDLNEWSDGQKPAFFPGLFNRLHPEGSHPGLSDHEDATFRLHIVLIAARLILRRFAKRIGEDAT